MNVQGYKGLRFLVHFPSVIFFSMSLYVPKGLIDSTVLSYLSLANSGNGRVTFHSSFVDPFSLGVDGC